ncbi:MAG: DsbA family protein [Gammaproteobacteria bacterium]
MKSTLYYILDPMCSWCWGFRSVFTALLELLSDQIEIEYVMGGLAPDSDQVMPEETRSYVQKQWQLVTEKTGAEFNWDFWTECTPRRSTYPACRAVISAGIQGKENIPKMIDAIQQAYYLEARNPSDLCTLKALAEELNLDSKKFELDITSPKIEILLQKDFETRKLFRVNSFPTVLLKQEEKLSFIAQGDESLDNILNRLQAQSLL